MAEKDVTNGIIKKYKKQMDGFYPKGKLNHFLFTFGKFMLDKSCTISVCFLILHRNNNSSLEQWKAFRQ